MNWQKPRISSSPPAPRDVHVRLVRRSPARYGRPWFFGFACLVGLAVFFGMGRPAWAHKNGIAASCDGCHSGGAIPMVTITADTSPIALGEMVVLTITVSNTNGPVAGFYVASSGPGTSNVVGTFSIVDTPGTQLIGMGATHTAPRAGVGGFTTFRVGWTAPAQQGGVDFNVWALSANNDGTTQGDGAGSAFLSVAYGCGVGTTYYTDDDQDGYARSGGYTVACSQPKYYTTVPGDCDDNDPTIHPGAMEVCNGRDDNCNGVIDEGLPVITYCTDADGDGHGVFTGPTMTGCRPKQGFGLCDQDCDDSDPNVYPGALEVCNNRDDNCNQMIDEDLSNACGAGWCRRYGSVCSPGHCTPGPPMREVCNSFDDDCDGVIDNGTNLDLCGKTGLVCSQGACVPAGQAAQDASLSTAGPNGDASVSQVSSPPFDLGEPPHQTIVDGAVVSASAAAAPTESRAGCGLSNEPCSTTGGLSVGVAWFLLSVFRRARRTNGQRVSE